jgi:hypothetical protein
VASPRTLVYDSTKTVLLNSGFFLDFLCGANVKPLILQPKRNFGVFHPFAIIMYPRRALASLPAMKSYPQRNLFPSVGPHRSSSNPNMNAVWRSATSYQMIFFCVLEKYGTGGKRSILGMRKLQLSSRDVYFCFTVIYPLIFILFTVARLWVVKQATFPSGLGL